MTGNPLRLFFGGIARFVHDSVGTVRDINRKYRTPRIHMTKWVKLSLLLLRLYLIVLVLILLYKFLTMVTGGGGL